MPELASERANVYAQADGTYRLEAFTVPVNYLDEGTWVPIDNDFVPAPGDAYAVENAANSYTVQVPADAGEDPVRFELDDEWVTLSMHGVDGAPAVAGAAATFTDVDAADEVIYEASATGVKESIVLTEPPAEGAGVFEYTVDVSAGLTPVLTDQGEILVQRPDESLVAVIPVGNMIDSASPEPAYTEDVTYELSPSGAAWTLHVEPDQDWLNAPERVYPVTIDPSIINPTPSRDCWVAQTEPTTSRCGTDYLRVGRSSSASYYRTLLKFDVSTIPTDATVNDTALTLTLDASQSYTSLSAEYSVFRSGTQWNNSATWNDSGASGAWTSSPGDPTGAAYATKTLDGTNGGDKVFAGTLSSLVADWVTGAKPNYGLVLRQTEPQANNVLYFHSSSSAATNNGKRPHLEVTYTVPDHAPAAPTGLTVSPGGPGYTTSNAPTLSATVSDPDGQQAVAQFSILQGSEEVWSGTSGAVASGSTASVEVPTGFLRPGETYTVSATAASGTPQLTSSPASVTVQVDHAAEETSGACTDPCTPFSSPPVLFEGELTGQRTVNLGSLPIEDLLDVGYVHFSLTATSGSASSSVTLYDPTFTVPVKSTLVAPANSQQTVTARLFPLDSQTVALTNNGSAPVNVRLTAIGWERWETPEEEAAQDDIYVPTDEEVAEFEQLDAQLAESEELGDDSPTTPGATTCESADVAEADTYYTCVHNFASEVQYESSIAGDQRSKVTTNVDPDLNDEEAATTYSERTTFSSCPSGSWEVERLEACTKRLLRIDHFKVTQNGPVYKGSTWVTVELKVTGAGWSIDPVIHGRFLYTKGTGWGKSIEITQHGDCYRCDHNWSFSNLASTYKRTSINTTVIQDDLTTGSVVRPDVGIKLSIISLIGISQGVPGKTAKFHFTSPDLRCDRLDYLSRGRGGGCVYDQVKPTAWISDGKYPKPAALIRKAQSDHHYGNQIPLTRLVNRSEIRANRRAARALCRRIQYTCDEYPFAASRQGCQKRPDLCYWKDVPAAQNSGAGGVVGTMLHSRRVFDYEGFYVKVYTP